MAELTLDYIEGLAVKLPAEEQQQLIERLARHLAATPIPASGKQLRSLRGVWQGKFPDDLDIEKEIRAIRDEWKQDFEQEGL